MGTKHHYVPRFYLRRFAIDPARRRVNVFNIPRRELFIGVGLKDQCYRDRFYWSDRNEATLAQLETQWALTIDEVIRSEQLPRRMSFDHIGLRLFIAAQVLRTAKSNDDLESMTSTMATTIARGNERIERMLRGMKNPVTSNLLHNFINAAFAIDDLTPRLLRVETPLFVTSDNPVVRYNQYMEEVQGFGSIGFAQRGLIIFLPLSPKLSLMLFDSHVYRVSNRKQGLISKLSEADVRQLNVLQALNAQYNLFVPNGFDRNACDSLAQQVREQRSAVGPEVQEFAEDGNPTSTLLMTYFKMPSVSLNLSFLEVQHEAQRVPLDARVKQWRLSNEVLDDLSGRYPSAPIPFGRKSRTFSRPIQPPPDSPSSSPSGRRMPR